MISVKNKKQFKRWVYKRIHYNIIKIYESFKYSARTLIFDDTRITRLIIYAWYNMHIIQYNIRYITLHWAIYISIFVWIYISWIYILLNVIHCIIQFETIPSQMASDLVWFSDIGCNITKLNTVSLIPQYTLKVNETLPD